MENQTPREIVAELDRYIVGQADAKRAVAIAMRNRWRRMRVDPSLRDEIAPKNIIMIGPTGVGKTEIARRLARMTDAPFVKVEASKFTEVGYVGRDVDTMVRDLVDVAVNIVREEETARSRGKAEARAEERLLDALYPATAQREPRPEGDARRTFSAGPGGEVIAEDGESTREKLRKLLREGRLDDRNVEIEVSDRSFPMLELISSSGVEEMNLKDMFSQLAPFAGKQKRRSVKVSEARELLAQEEAQKLLDQEAIRKAAIERAENTGIIFIDEIDKIAGRERSAGPEVSREGVQRDILPIIEGSTVNTKHGSVRTDHVLFVAAGAFHVAKPSDLIPELQGRFPIRVELKALSRADLLRILKEPKNALTRQYAALLAVEGIEVIWEDSALEAIADMAALVNERMENIGARRLHTIMERLLEDLSFDAPDVSPRTVRIDEAYVRKQLEQVVTDVDLSRYIL
ncbi:MAG: ATP-dependent protease ATPase subunit HslU [Deltaproteobacteria bacterium]|nr:ATP-dependent protease ATPase subunit HslU [Deltaproteobacteria bacterium]